MKSLSRRGKRKVAAVVAVAVEIYCPNDTCLYGGFEDPIPARDGSFVWDHIPEEVTCPRCGQTFRVSRKVRWS